MEGVQHASTLAGTANSSRCARSPYPRGTPQSKFRRSGADPGSIPAHPTNPEKAKKLANKMAKMGPKMAKRRLKMAASPFHGKKSAYFFP